MQLSRNTRERTRITEKNNLLASGIHPGGGTAASWRPLARPYGRYSSQGRKAATSNYPCRPAPRQQTSIQSGHRPRTLSTSGNGLLPQTWLHEASDVLRARPYISPLWGPLAQACIQSCWNRNPCARPSCMGNVEVGIFILWEGLSVSGGSSWKSGSSEMCGTSSRIL